MSERRRTERGFAIYDEFQDTHGTTVRVQESSAAGSACWVFCDDPSMETRDRRTGQGLPSALHLNPGQVSRLVVALGQFLTDYHGFEAAVLEESGAGFPEPTDAMLRRAEAAEADWQAAAADCGRLQARVTQLERVRTAAAALWAKDAQEDGAPPDTVTEWCELINALEACDG